LTGCFALIGVLIAQGVVLYITRRNDKRRSEPELLKHCANFSAACGRLKRELALKKPEDWDLSCLDQLNASSDALVIIATPEIEDAAEKIEGIIQLVFMAHEETNKTDFDEQLSRLFRAQMRFTDTVRKHFNRPKKVYMAVPIIRPPEKQKAAQKLRKHQYKSPRPASSRRPPAPRRSHTSEKDGQE
jgi:hypothetical protein